MELKEFVSETLTSIIEGIREAQSEAQKLDAFVNPGGLMRNTDSLENNSIWDNRSNNYARPVNFDIAITAEDSKNAGAKVKVLSGFLGGDVGGEKAAKNVVASRIQFTVPILFPVQDIGDPEAREPKQKLTKLEKSGWGK